MLLTCCSSCICYNENLRLFKADCDTFGDVLQVNVERKYPVYFELYGEGVDEEPEGVLSIDRKTGTIYANKAVDYEARTRLKVGLNFLMTELFVALKLFEIHFNYDSFFF